MGNKCYSDSVLYWSGSISATSLLFKGVNKKEELADSLPPVSDCTLTGSQRALAHTYSASLSEGNSSNTALQGSSFYFQMNAELNAASL